MKMRVLFMSKSQKKFTNSKNLQVTFRETMNLYASDKLEDLSTEGQTFFELLTLITDIKYRIKYGETFDEQRGKGYSQNIT